MERFIQLWLSDYIIVVSNSSLNKYESRFQSHTTSLLEALVVDTERGVNQYQVQFKNLFNLILKPFNYT
jgi:hypothetical protein